jgi:hypothetical protein
VAITHDEVAARCLPPTCSADLTGLQRLLRDAGFPRIEVMDTTASAAEISERWHNAREKHGEALVAIEGRVNFEGLQKFLATVEKLCRERRLLRLLYVAERPGN